MSKMTDTLHAYMAKKNIGPWQLAKDLNIPPTTVHTWFKHNIRKPRVRVHVKKLGERFPGIFDTIEAPTVKPTELPKHPETDPIDLQVRIRLVEHLVHITGHDLEWFVFHATPDMRHRFRDSLGKQWEWFLDLTRAMTSEKALEVIRAEGRLNGERRPGI